MAAAADEIHHELLYGDRLVHCYAQRPRNLDDMLRRAVALGDGRAALADYKTPDFVTSSSTPLPRNLNGKLVKATLREQARADALQRLPCTAGAPT